MNVWFIWCHKEHISTTDFNHKIQGQENVDWNLHTYFIEIYILEEKSYLIILRLLIVLYCLPTYWRHFRNDLSFVKRKNPESVINAAFQYTFSPILHESSASAAIISYIYTSIICISELWDSLNMLLYVFMTCSNSKR